MQRAWRFRLGATALVAAAAGLSFACGSSSTPVGGVDAGAPDSASYVSCAYTSEPAQPPCSQYLGLRGDLVACGIPDGSAAGALSSAACLANCTTTSSCSLVVDAAVAPGIGDPGYPIIACGCP